jgi:hypothetical protein
MHLHTGLMRKQATFRTAQFGGRKYIFLKAKKVVPELSVSGGSSIR